MVKRSRTAAAAPVVPVDEVILPEETRSPSPPVVVLSQVAKKPRSVSSSVAAAAAAAAPVVPVEVPSVAPQGHELLRQFLDAYLFSDTQAPRSSAGTAAALSTAGRKVKRTRKPSAYNIRIGQLLKANPTWIMADAARAVKAEKAAQAAAGIAA